MSIYHTIHDVPPSWKIEQAIMQARKSLGRVNREADPVRRKLGRRMIMRTLNSLRADLRKAEDLEGLYHG